MTTIRKTFRFLAVVALLPACGACPPPRAAHAEPAAPSGNAALHVRAYELFSAHDAAMFDLFADNIVEHHVEGPPVEGRAALEAFNRAFWAGFSDIHVEVDVASARGDYSIVSVRIVGTNDGPMPLFGVDSTGRRIDVGFVEVVRWRDGHAVDAWPYMDEAALMHQLTGGP